MPSANGEGEEPHAPLELHEVIHIQTSDGASRAFEVVGILEDPEAGDSYAVLVHEPANEGEAEFIVTDLGGNMLENAELAQEVLEEFLAFAEDDDHAKDRNGEMS